MGHPAKITDHIDLGLALILSHYANSPRLQALAAILLGQVQDLEDLAYDYLTQQLLPNAVGVHLERLGRRVGQLRGLHTDDDEFRRIIEARVLSNTSHGGVDRLITIVDKVMSPYLTGDLPDVRWFRFGRAHLRIEYDVDSTPPQRLRDSLGEIFGPAVVGGVSWTLVEVDDADSFRYDLGPGYDTGTYARIVASG